MTQGRNEVFIQWLDKNLAENHLTDSQLSKKAKMSHSVLSKARNGILPKWEACAKIARALRVDPIEVFQAAGLVQLPRDLDSDFERLKFVYSSLPTNQRKLAIRLIDVLIEED
jgi:transcriptional regulator with XRE-family HTH domain